MEELIIEYLKNEAKSQGVSQSVLASALEVSLPTVKRWYAGKGLSLDSLRKICDFLGCSLTEVISYAEGGSVKLKTYTHEQEVAFIRDPKLLVVFDYLMRKKSVTSIKNKYNLSEAEMHGILYKLDKLHLIELHAQYKVKLKFDGEPSWIPGGPLSQHFRSKILDDFIGDHNKMDTVFYLHEYTQEDLLSIKSKIQELENFVKLAHKRSLKSEGSSQSYGVYIACKKYEWDLGKYLKK